MKSRIEHIIKAESLSNLQFANSLEISPAAVTHLLSGRNNPSLDIVVRIAQKYPHYNLRWMLLGEGAIYNIGHAATASVNREPELFATSNPSGQSSTALASSNSAGNNSEKAAATPISAQPSATPQNDNSAEQQKLIVCLPDGTYREFIKQ